MAKHIKVQKPKTIVEQGTCIPCTAVLIHHKMGEMGNRAEFKDETMLQFTLFVPTKKRQAGKLERATLFVPNLGTALPIGKNFNMCCWVDVNWFSGKYP